VEGKNVKHGVEYKDEHSQDLRLHLFRGPLALEAFPVLERVGRRVGEFEVDACIIGASHAVQIRRGSETLTEVLACHVEAVDLYADRLVGVWRADEIRTKAGDGLDYRFRVDIAPLNGARDRISRFRESAVTAEQEGAIGLTFRFPQKTAETPETLLRVSADETDLRIESIHVYPGEHAAVISETRLVPRTATSRHAAAELMEVGPR